MEERDMLNPKHEEKKSLEDEEWDVEGFLEQFAFSCYSPPTQNNSAFGFLNDNFLNHSNPINLSFCDSTVVTAPTHNESCSRERAGSSGPANGTNHSPSKPRTSSASLEHVMKERKRRQQHSQKFIELSASIPGLNKIDKASILKEAITYIKHLQNRVKELEEPRPKINVESVSCIDKTNSADCCGQNVALPKLEARVLEKEVLIRTHCKNHKGVLPKILTHIKSLNLSIVSKSVLPIGKFSLHITVIAKMDEKCNLIVKDLVKSLRRVLLDLPDAQ